MKTQQLCKLSLLVLCLLAFTSQAVKTKTRAHTNLSYDTAQGAWNTCSSFKFAAPTTLSASCKYTDSIIFGIKTTKHKTTTLNLDKCLGNINGTYVCGSTDYSLSTSNITLSGSTLRGDLENADGGSTISTIDLNKVVSNNKGTLVCGC